MSQKKLRGGNYSSKRKCVKCGGALAHNTIGDKCVKCRGWFN